MSDSIKTFITDAIEYITNAEICQIHKTAQTRTVDATCVKVAFYGEYGAGVYYVLDRPERNRKARD